MLPSPGGLDTPDVLTLPDPADTVQELLEGVGLALVEEEGAGDGALKGLARVHGVVPAVAPRARAAAQSPGQHAVDDVVHEVVVEPLRVVQQPLLAKAQTLGHGAAPTVGLRAPDLDAVQPLLVEGVVQQGAGGARHEPASLIGLSESSSRAR